MRLKLYALHHRQKRDEQKEERLGVRLIVRSELVMGFPTLHLIYVDITPIAYTLWFEYITHRRL